MKIVFVLPDADLSGGVRTVAIYAQLLARRGHVVRIVSTPSPTPPLKSRIQSFARGEGWGRRPTRSHVDDINVDHHRIDRFRPVTDRDVPDADVVIATWWLTSEWVAELSSRKGAKVHFVQDDEAVFPRQPTQRVAATWRLPFQRIVVSRWLLDVARNQYGDVNALHVPNGVDLEHFAAPARDKQARPTVGLVYTDAFRKGCDVAVDAFERAVRRVSGLRLIAFGSAGVNPAVRLPQEAEFTLRPSQDVIPKLYASCDLWLWPSRREGFGLPILESLACRTPVVATPAGAAPELLESGGGVLLPSWDASGMADAIVQLMGCSNTEWRQLSEQARAVAARHDWSHSVDMFESVLKRVA